MEGPLQTEGHPNFNDKNGTSGIEESVTSTFSGLNLDPNQPINFSDANAESERNGDDQHIEHRVINDQLENQDDSMNKERRRGSMERYKPPINNSYSREEREKHRRRGHFGEAKTQDDYPSENDDTGRGKGRPHGRFRGKGRNKNANSSPSTYQTNSNEQNADDDEIEAEPKDNGARGSYKSQLSKDWADYSFEDDNKPAEEEVDEELVLQQCLQSNAKTHNQDNRTWNEKPNKENLARRDTQDRNQNRNYDRRGDKNNSKYDKNYGQRNDYSHQNETTDLRQKLNEKRAANGGLDHDSNSYNQQHPNGNSSYHGDQNRRQQRPPKGVVQGNWASNVERRSNDRSHGYRGREREGNIGGNRPNIGGNRPSNFEVSQSASGNLPRPKKNTENFNPCYEPPEMRILFATPGVKHYDRPCGSRDVIIVVRKIYY